jgi:hypothetical protein
MGIKLPPTVVTVSITTIQLKKKKPGILSLPDHAILVPYSQPRKSHGATDR